MPARGNATETARRRPPVAGTRAGRIRRILAPVVLVLAVALVLVVRERIMRQDVTDSSVVPSDETVIEPVPATVTAPESSVSLPISDAVTVEDSVRVYIARLGDQGYTETYGEEFVWYVAAEELGMIGRPAIPALIERLGTGDDFERTQALYALRLAAQHENMRGVTGGAYVDLVSDAFPSPEMHPELVRAWREWYGRYGPAITASVPLDGD